jgi:rare lipoprotein A
MTVVSTPAAGAAAPPDYTIDNGHFYIQGAGSTGGGYSITDDGGVPLWTEYNRLGGPDVLGYPISGRFVLDGHVIQLTQKVGLVWYPDANRVRFLNIFDWLHFAGKDDWLASTKGIPAPADTGDENGKTWEQVAQKRYQLLDLHPAVKSAYFAQFDPAKMYGLPTSGWSEQPLSSVLRFQNVAFQQWKQLLPWAAPGQVQMANGGDILKESGILGPLPFQTQSPPAQSQQLSPAGFAVISYYADTFVGAHTSTGLVFSQDLMTAASNGFPLGSKLKLSTPDGKHSVVVTNNDRPAAGNQRIDLSKAAFAELYPISSGLGTVKVELVA